MTLLLSMLPFYFFGNLHCLGMCGPLVMMIGKHRFRNFYFAGRLLSFSFTGLLAGEMGAVLQVILNQYRLSSLLSLSFGSLILLVSFSTLFGWRYPGYTLFNRSLAGIQHSLSLLILKDQAWPTFLFGFFTVALPCGQSLIVFSACALSGEAWIGLVNGFAFGLLTTPSLFFAMHAHRLFFSLKNHYNVMIGVFGAIVGILAICRGLADMEAIPHLTLNFASESLYHLVIF